MVIESPSAGKALSIQAHPASPRGKAPQGQARLIQDSNHKPEMAIALTPFEAMRVPEAVGDRRPFRKHRSSPLVFLRRRSSPCLRRVLGIPRRRNACTRFESFMAGQRLLLQLDTRRGGLLDGVTWIRPRHRAIDASPVTQRGLRARRLVRPARCWYND